ncbi:hypothetical protein BU17DRAFT_89634 [Hysterangium stoloniferum]|nr:hypothetical protein BU17DRAFT_89634 [Hysterangium stoloniferum]
MPDRVKATNSLEALLKKSPPSTSNAGFNQVAVLIWTFVIQVARAVMDWSQAHFEEMAPLLRASEAVQKKSASPSVKCGKCSAKGHQASACRSKNPAAVRRRIAANHKKRNRPTPLPVYANAIAPHYPFPFIAPQYASLSVEGTELRRRKAQSRRDRARAKSKGNSTPALATTTSSSKPKSKTTPNYGLFQGE